MSTRAMALIHDDRLFPADPVMRNIARRVYQEVRDLPLISPHGHTQAGWFASNRPFPDPAKLLVQPDHYIYRMLYSQGVSLADLEIGAEELKDPRRVWRIFAENYYLFRGTPTRLWLDRARTAMIRARIETSLSLHRQPMKHGGNRVGQNAAAEHRRHGPRAIEEQQPCTLGLEGNFGAVSYTHLDVYKRQPKGRPGRPDLPSSL